MIASEQKENLGKLMMNSRHFDALTRWWVDFCVWTIMGLAAIGLWLIVLTAILMLCVGMLTGGIIITLWYTNKELRRHWRKHKQPRRRLT